MTKAERRRQAELERFAKHIRPAKDGRDYHKLLRTYEKKRRIRGFGAFLGMAAITGAGVVLSKKYGTNG